MGNGLSAIRRMRSTTHQGRASGSGPSSRQGAQLPYFHQAGGAITAQAYIQNNGQLAVNIQPSAVEHPNIIGDPSAAVPLPLPDLENHKANTIKNDVNLKKSTLRLEKDEENPGYSLVAFSFDALVPGWICIFFLAKEGEQCSLNPIKPDLFMPIRVPFEKGLGQNFRQACGTGVNLSLFDECELLDDGNGEVSPIVVRTETVPKACLLNSEQAKIDIALNAPLPIWVHAQTTHAALEKKDGIYQVKVGKQIIYVEGVRYELQEIYGIENADGSDEGAYGNDCGKDCVICLSELRDTTVLPCRHMCMCSACAKVLRFQSSRCPICRTPVERLLEIKVSNRDQDKGTAWSKTPD
ncbi:hypothetical protein GOP47_0006600 [Adiantum capillus-veneris]|uniref:RING-type E3 ubiquitin transferase n=1 Tax=Adiantum capillus-veneris TaxID=13818 RepID=A0A9D4V364_ADICA|nr:hypothetical protein GOP47_0006600 [Adiantum capillus-veneris]